MGEVAYLKKEFEKTETHFKETVAICEGAGYYQVTVDCSVGASFDGALPATRMYGNHIFASHYTHSISLQIVRVAVFKAST